MVCLEAYEPFGSDGAFYRDYTQTDDAGVISLLNDAYFWAAICPRKSNLIGPSAALIEGTNLPVFCVRRTRSCHLVPHGDQ